MLKKFGEKITRKKLIIASGIAIVLMAMVIAIAIILSKGESARKKNFVPDSELARAMTYGQFSDEDANVDGTDYVKFNAFFLRDVNSDGIAEKIKGTCKQVGKEDTLYMELNVLTNGYLENGVITINSDNFYLRTAIPKDNEVKDNLISYDTEKISLNQINNGTQKLLTGIVTTGNYSKDSQKYAAIGNDPTKYSKINSITLTGTHVADDGTRTEINKTVNLAVDWYGTTKTEIPNYIIYDSNLSQTKDNTYVVDKENNQAVFEFDIGIKEANSELLLSKAYLEGVIPQLNGYDPEKVEVINEGAKDSYTYDETTRRFTAIKSAKLNDDGTIDKQCYDITYLSGRYNKFKLKVAYPLEAYNETGADTVELKIPVSAYYEGYNNTNTEFVNPYKSNVANATVILTYSKPSGDVAIFEVTVGKYTSSPNSRYYVSKKKPLKIYNGLSSEENDDTYLVRWYGSTGKQGQTTGLVMKETKDGVAQVSDQLIKSDSSTESMENFVANVGIYFSNPMKLLGDDGWIKVYDDETGVLLHEFNKSDWNKYSEGSPYKYDIPVKHIRVVTSATQPSKAITVYNVKKVYDDYVTTNYTREQFDNFNYIKSTLTGYAGESCINTDTHDVKYEAPFSIATVEINKEAISTQETEKDMYISIVANGEENANQEKWENGAFLLKLPKDIVTFDIDSIKINNSMVTLVSYEVYEEDGEKFLKIITSNDEATTFSIGIECSISPDPRMATATESFELYASNENAGDYYIPVDDVYDINGNLNVTEKVNKDSVSISMISPNSLLTNQSLTNYDENGSVTVAPMVAEVTKERSSATVNVEINNNYSSTISDVVILGRVPFQGNKYVINGKDLGSTFTTTMSNSGLKLTEALEKTAKVYYSTNGEATKDLEKSENGWTLSPTDYSKVKSYLIDFGEYQFKKGERYTVSYDVGIPSGLNYNEVTYGHHAVYFSLDTTEGKYKTQTEPNKVGIMIAKQYDLELIKFQNGKEKTVSGATYAIQEDGKEESKTRVTSVDGSLNLTGLYIDRTYIVKEIKSPKDYELNDEVVRFTTSESDGKIIVTKNDGNVKNIQAIQPTGSEEYKVQIQVEDEAKARLKIIKNEKDSSKTIPNVRYKLTGVGIISAGRVLATNVDGEAQISGLKIGEEYVLEEVKAEGYYVSDEKIKFTVTNSNGVYSANILEGTVKNSSITEEDSLPIINLQLEDDKIPTYNLEISKIKRIASTAVTTDELKAKAEKALASEDTVYLSGAKFKLYKDGKELGEYTTDANGKITLEGLYQYIDGKDENAIYTLIETQVPDGYVKVNDITFKVDGTSGELQFINTNGKNESYTVDGNTVKLLIEDSPSFKLIKKDADTQEVLANIKFAIYNLDQGTVPAKNSKGETLGTKEIINGKEYYTVTTDSNGEITADLPEGIYKAVEVQAPEKYEISEDYYFRISSSTEGKTNLETIWGEGIGNETYDQVITSMATSDGGFLVGGKKNTSESITLENGIVIDSQNNSYIIKYDSNGRVDWAHSLGDMYDDRQTKYMDFSETSDGGYLVAGSMFGTLDLGNNITLKSYGSYDGVIIKYNSDGVCEWAKNVGTISNDQFRAITSTSDGGFIVGGYIKYANLQLDSDTTINVDYVSGEDAILIKYNQIGEVEWIKTFNGEPYGDDRITNVIQMDDGGYIVEGHSNGKVDFGNGVVVECSGDWNGLLIRYSATGEVEWAKKIDGYLPITSISKTKDNGFIISGQFESSLDLGNGETLKGISGYDGFIIKYDGNGNVKWAKAVGGVNEDKINCIITDKEGNYWAVGYFYSGSVDLGDGIGLSKNGSAAGMVIKYNPDGKCLAAQSLGGNGEQVILNSVVIDEQKNIIVSGKSTMPLTINIKETSTSKQINIGIVVKFEESSTVGASIVEATKLETNNLNSVTEVDKTSDGGSIAVGNFSSATMNFGEIELKKYGVTTSVTDGYIAKYNENNVIEWVKNIGGDEEVKFLAVEENHDNGYVVAGLFNSNISFDDGRVLEYLSGGTNGLLIKFDQYGNIEWFRNIGSKIQEGLALEVTSDDGILVAGSFWGDTLTLSNGGVLHNNSGTSNSAGDKYSDGMIIKYTSDGQVDWGKAINGVLADRVTSVIELSDGSYVVGGYFNSQITFENGTSITTINSNDGFMVNYYADGTLKQANTLKCSGDLYINCMIPTSDGGYLVGGSFNGGVIRDDVAPIYSKGYLDGVIDKYDSQGKREWVQNISGEMDDYVTSLAQMNNGKYIIGGCFSSSAMSVGSGISLSTAGECDGMLLVYDSKGNAESAKVIGGESNDYVRTVTVKNTGDVLFGGDFKSPSVKFDKMEMKNNNDASGFISMLTMQITGSEVEELQISNNV